MTANPIINFKYVKEQAEYMASELIGMGNFEIDSTLEADEIEAHIYWHSDSDLHSYAESSLITYVHEAFNVLDCPDFRNHPSVADMKVDFSDETCSFDCVRKEARAWVDAVWYELMAEAIKKIAVEISDVCTVACDFGYEGKIRITLDSLYGWAVCNYQTSGDVCVYSDERFAGAYNPELLEGELWAVEGSYGNLWFSACWHPNN